MSLPLAQIDSRAEDVLIALNPRAGARSQLAVVEDLVHRLFSFGLKPRVFTSIAELLAAAERTQAEGTLRAVVAAGGDGTARLMAERTVIGTPLTILPLGTENLLARHFEFSTDTRALALRIVAGYTVQLDAGEANGHLFTLMVGCGFDADVVRRLHKSRRGHIHHLSYVKPIIDSIRNYDYPPLQVHYFQANAVGTTEPGVCQTLTARWVFVVNLPRYAGGLDLAPGASATDGLLDICTFKQGSLWRGLGYLGRVMLGKHETMTDYCRVRSREIRIEAPSAVPYQVDGDPGGELPLTIRVLPKRLTLVVSRAWAERHGFPAQESIFQ